MKSIFATPEDLVRNLANMSKEHSFQHDADALNRLIDEARALCKASPKEAEAPRTTRWLVHLRGVAPLVAQRTIVADSEADAQSRALAYAQGYDLEEFDVGSPSDIVVVAIERLP